jgi:fatty acid desaturase
VHSTCRNQSEKLPGWIKKKVNRWIFNRSPIENGSPDARDQRPYRVTRTTLPTRLQAVFILPRNIGFHIEHRWYPGVPFYRLPELHQLLMAHEGFNTHAAVRRSVVTSLSECIKP